MRFLNAYPRSKQDTHHIVAKSEGVMIIYHFAETYVCSGGMVISDNILEPHHIKEW